MELTQFKDLAQAIQSIGIFLGAIIAGIWALYRVSSSKELKKTRIEVKDLKKKVKNKEGLESQIECEFGEEINDGIPGFISIKLQNKSDETICLKLGEKPLSIGLVKTDKTWDGLYLCDWKSHINLLSTSPNNKDLYAMEVSKTILPHSCVTLSFLNLFKENGIYFVSFRYGMSSFHREQVKESTEEDIKTEIGWQPSINKYFQLTKISNKAVE